MGITRRTFLVAAGSAAAVPWAARTAAARSRVPLARGASFPCGVLSGLPHQRGAPLCARLDGLEGRGRVAIEVAADPGFARVLHHERVTVGPGSDHVAHVALRSPRLQPGGEYWYRFATADADSPVGRLRTRRPPDSAEPVRLAFWSCQAYQSGYYVAHRALATEPDLDAVVGLGDYIYERSSDSGPRTDPLPNAQSLEQYRAKYRLYQSDPDLLAMHAAHPFVCCWDDHEVMSSYYGEAPGNAQGAEPILPFPERRRNGYRAFFEHLPIERFAGNRDRIYRRLRFGAQAELFLTDLHQYASPPPDCPGPMEGAVNLGPCPDAMDPRRTLLGPVQREWLTRGLAGSGAAWKLWGTSMMLMALDSLPRVPFTIGEWSGWEGERNSLAAELHARGVRDLAAFSGDIHTFFAGQWTTTGRLDGSPVGTEFVAGSITSHGIAESTGLSPQLAAVLTDRLPVLNPHLAFADTLHHGYAVATATAGELRVEFRAPRSTIDPHSDVFTLASFVVPRGEPRVHLA